MKVFTLIGGVNGVGKSSFSGVLRETVDLGYIIDPNYLAVLNGNNAIAGGRKAIELRNQFFAEGKTFAQESTLAGRSIRDAAKNAKELGYRVRLFYVALDADLRKHLLLTRSNSVFDECLSAAERVQALVQQGCR